MLSNAQLREKQINEILNQDRYINQKVVNLFQKSIRKYDEDLAPIPAADNAVLGDVQTVLDKLNGIINNKISLFETVPESMHRFLDISDFKSVASALGEINKVDEVITLYNAIIKSFLQPSTMTASSKIAFQTKLQTLAQSIQVIYNKLERIIIIYIKEFNITPARTQGAKANKADDSLLNVGRVITRMISTFCVYRIIKEQIETGNFYVIELSNFEHEVKRLSDRNPEVRRFLEKFKQEIDPRLHPITLGRLVEQSAEFQDELKKRIDDAGANKNKKKIKEITDKLKAEFSIDEAKLVQSMRTDTLTAYEHELGRPMSSEERQLFFPISSAASSSAVVPAPAALGEVGESEAGSELPALEEVGAEEEEEDQKLTDLNAHIKVKYLEYKAAYAQQQKTKQEFDETYEKTYAKLQDVLGPLLDDPTVELQQLIQIADEIFEEFFKKKT